MLSEELDEIYGLVQLLKMTTNNAFRYFKASPEVIRLAVMYYVRFPLSFRQVEDILHDRDVDICHETA